MVKLGDAEDDPEYMHSDEDTKPSSKKLNGMSKYEEEAEKVRILKVLKEGEVD